MKKIKCDTLNKDLEKEDKEAPQAQSSKEEVETPLDTQDEADVYPQESAVPAHLKFKKGGDMVFTCGDFNMTISDSNKQEAMYFTKTFNNDIREVDGDDTDMGTLVLKPHTPYKDGADIPADPIKYRNLQKRIQYKMDKHNSYQGNKKQYLFESGSRNYFYSKSLDKSAGKYKYKKECKKGPLSKPVKEEEPKVDMKKQVEIMFQEVKDKMDCDKRDQVAAEEMKKRECALQKESDKPKISSHLQSCLARHKTKFQWQFQ